MPPDSGADDPDASTEPHPETVVGADPDVDPDADWTPADFPDQLDFAAPEPVDGYPWSDPSAVAAPGTGGEDPAHGPDGSPPAQDLLDYAGERRRRRPVGGAGRLRRPGGQLPRPLVVPRHLAARARYGSGPSPTDAWR